ncbi:dihydroxyacetone kinase subunit DhaK [Aureimonas sp. Leaf324]|jgi:dihydroxyacetone kinase|uniref:dihydroxyacetone kinase subunit DhaK n=1 Tax=Aureimonas sp. Leaf324 TaxID=1736336 RepID=UPI0006FF4426|nr:dihydroxyacetone kinase subunit DhaK [Aureimonas sp. Leaf324]KQQ81852.1 dihydroxyacetone kinase [Aureimonas sp. Leaf324]
MKKLINEPLAVVDEMLEGLCLAHPGLALLEGERVLVRADLAAFRDCGHVALVSGGGSGHEPAHAGYVGEGLLTAAVCGDVFTSPSTDAVLAAIRAVGGAAGVLLIVKNYTGDRLNFGLAAEIARGEGIPVEMVVVADDVALAASTETAGRRGIAGTVLVHKVAGARAAEGATLAEVTAAAEKAIAGLGSMGVALSACTVPAAGKPGFELGEREVELGLGIHGEAGVRRELLRPSRELTATLVERIVAELSLGRDTPVALLVNNLGATPVMEMQIVARDAVAAARSHGLVIERLWTGTFLTALDMAGCSVSLLRADPDTLRLLDAPAAAPAWPGRGAGPLGREGPIVVASPRREGQDLRPGDGARTVAILTRAAERLIAEEGRLTALDQTVGDGDLGLNLARGAEVAMAEATGWTGADAASILRALSGSLRRSVGGTSGALYAAGLLRAARALDGIAAPTSTDWAEAFREGTDAVATLGDAKPGDRTMLDALLPAADALSRGGLAAAVEAARAGAAATAAMAPRRGRSSYLGDRAVGVPDPGAEAVVVWLAAIRHEMAAD